MSVDFLSIRNNYGGASVSQLKRNTEETQLSVAKLSSGKRMVRASDDVASLAISTKLAARISSLKSGQNNLLQASSLFSTADGALQKISDALNRMQQLTGLAASGVATPQERAYLNQEFQQLHNEIDRIANQTNFNGIDLLKSDPAETIYNDALNTKTTLDNRAHATLSWTSNPSNNQTLIVQGITFRFRTVPAAPTDVRIGANLGATLRNLATAMANYPDLRMSEATYSVPTIPGSDFVITSASYGELAKNFTINEQGSSSRARFTIPDATQVEFTGDGRYMLGDGAENGLGAHSTQPAGNPQDPLFVPQAQTSGEVVLRIANPTGGIANGQQLRIDDGFTTTLNFTFRTTANPLNPLDIQIGPNNAETLQNAVTKLNSWVDTFGGTQRSYAMRQLEFSRNGLDLSMQYRGFGNGADFNEANIAFAETLTGGTLSAASMTNGQDSGISTEGVANPAFVGKVGGFQVMHVPPNIMALSLQVGDQTYRANTAAPFIAATTVRMHSSGGGYFDMTFAGGANPGVVDEKTAGQFADRLDRVFDEMTFYQTRAIESYLARAPLDNTTLEVRSDDYDTPLVVQDISVEKVGSNSLGRSAKISMTINGEVYENNKTVDQSIEPYSKLTLVNLSHPERQIIFKNSLLEFDLTTDTGAKMFEDALKDNIPLGSIVQTGGATLSFQDGDLENNTLDYNVVDARADTLFEKGSFNLLSADSANEAGAQVEKAIDTVTSYRAYVGSLQSRADYSLAYSESAIRSQDASMATLSDTDIPSESTDYSSAVVRGQISANMLSQANVLHENLLSSVFDAVSGLPKTS